MILLALISALLLAARLLALEVLGAATAAAALFGRLGASEGGACSSQKIPGGSESAAGAILFLAPSKLPYSLACCTCSVEQSAPLFPCLGVG